MSREMRILRINALLLIGPFGIGFAAGAWPPVYEILRPFFLVVHWPFFDPPASLDPTGRLLIAILGGLAAGLGAAVWVVATHVMPVAPEAGRKVVFAASYTWYATDSLFSLVAGSPVNVLSNTALLAMLVVPCHMSAREAVRS